MNVCNITPVRQPQCLWKTVVPKSVQTSPDGKSWTNTKYVLTLLVKKVIVMLLNGTKRAKLHEMTREVTFKVLSRCYELIPAFSGTGEKVSIRINFANCAFSRNTTMCYISRLII